MCSFHDIIVLRTSPEVKSQMGMRKKYLSSKQQIACSIIRMKKLHITEKYTGSGSVLHLAEIMRNEGARKVMIVTDETVADHGHTINFEEKLNDFDIEYTRFTDTDGKADDECLEKGFEYFVSEKCDTVMAIGGGTVIDCAKLIALRAANPSKNMNYFLDYTSSPKQAVPLYAAPTTPGSGSEISLIAFYTDQKGRKCPVFTPEMVPRAAALDPDFLYTLGPEMTSFCGMNTLTRAIESYISTYSERFYRDTLNAPKACRMVFENLYEAVLDPDNITAKINLLKASYYAGVSYRRSIGGYISSLANRMTELYDIPFGKACAVFLPIILEEYMPEIITDLAAISYHCDFTDDRNTEVENAFRMIEQIKDLNMLLGLPDHFEELLEKDINLIIKRTQNDVRICGCPKIFTDSELESVLYDLTYKRKH